MEKHNESMNNINKNIIEINEDVSIDFIKKALNASDKDHIYMISKHNERMPEFIMITKHNVLLSNMDYVLEDFVLNDKIMVNRELPITIQIILKYKNSVYNNDIKKYKYYICKQLIEPIGTETYMIPVFKFMKNRRFVCAGNLITSTAINSNDVTKLNVLDFSFRGIGETFYIYKKMFEKDHGKLQEPLLYSELSDDTIEIKNYDIICEDAINSSMLYDDLGKIIFMLNLKK